MEAPGHTPSEIANDLTGTLKDAFLRMQHFHVILEGFGDTVLHQQSVRKIDFSKLWPEVQRIILSKGWHLSVNDWIYPSEFMALTVTDAAGTKLVRVRLLNNTDYGRSIILSVHPMLPD